VVSVTDHFLWQDHGFRMLVASFGASAVLLYGVPESKLAQPRNLVGELMGAAQHKDVQVLDMFCLRWQPWGGRGLRHHGQRHRSKS
jgi:CBS-domain-containing membrane protein